MAVELATAHISLIPSFRGGIGAIQAEASKMGKAASDTISGEVTKSTGAGGKIAKAFGGIGSVIAGGFAGGAAVSVLANAVGGFISAAQDSQKVAKQTAAVLTSTGGAAKVSASQISDLSTALSMKSGVDDEVIQSGENVLLTFTKIRNETGAGNDIFNQATAAALDMSAALGTDLQGSVVQVGKALNDPIKGVTALQRVGVSFTESQKEQIKTLVETGDTLGAQKLILGELSTEFGGAAAAGATSSDKLKVAWGNVQEQLGNALLPTFEKVTTWLAAELPGAIAKAQEFIDALSKWWKDHGDQVMAVVGFLFNWIKTEVQIYVAAIKVEWEVLSDIVVFLNNWVVQPIIRAVSALVAFLTSAFQAAVAGVRTAWSVISTVFDFFRDNVYNPLSAAVGVLAGIIALQFNLAVAGARIAWSGIAAVWTFFRDNVYNPLSAAVGVLAGIIALQFNLAVAGARIAWSGIAAVWTFFRDNVYNPVSTAVADLANGIVRAFQLAVQAVALVWDGIKAVVKAPINVVIDFYNNGIAAVWNFVASKVGLPTLSAVQHLASGGRVPGQGNRDTVPAMLTPGEFVVTKRAAQAWGSDVLEMLNKGPAGTVDPAIFGYAGGGTVKSVEETQAWMRQQAGKPYVFPLTGPNAFDCSGFASALLDFVLGTTQWVRRFSSGTVGTDRALQRGDGDPSRGLLIGARPPYTTNSSGDFVGHMTTEVAGLNAEATPPAVRVGGNARGAFALPEHYFLPGFGGPNAEEQGIIDKLKSLLSMAVPDLGGTPFANMLEKLFTDLPRHIFDFLVTKMPSIIFDAVKDAAVSVFKLVTPFGDGGTTRPGPIVVGEKGYPELMWARGGEYIQPLGPGGPGGLNVTVQGSIFGDAEFRRMIREEVANLEFQRRASPRMAGF
jgi:hypothetical protein